MNNQDLQQIAMGCGNPFELLRSVQSLKLNPEWDDWVEGNFPRPAITQDRLDNFDIQNSNDGFNLLRAARNGQLEVK